MASALALQCSTKKQREIFKYIKCRGYSYKLRCANYIYCFQMTKLLEVLTIYMGNREIPVGKSNGSRHSVWEASENMGCDLRRASFPLLLVCLIDLDLFCSGSYSHVVKFYRFMVVHKISTRVVCVNGEHWSVSFRSFTWFAFELGLLVVHAREPASFWRENVIAVLILLRNEF